MSKKKLILIGGGGHCKSCIDVIECTNLYEIDGIMDTNELLGKSVLNYSIKYTDENLVELVRTGFDFIITIGQIKSSEVRVNVFNNLKNLGYKFPTIISPLAYVSKHASIDEGTMIHHGAIINAGAVIGKNCIINSKALIEHDAKIGNHCHISTGALVNGGVLIHNGTFFGSGAVSKQSIEIAENSFIKANSIVK